MILWPPGCDATISDVDFVCAGEAWAERIQKIALEHDDEGRLGIIYLDLYPRYPQAQPRGANVRRCQALHVMFSLWSL